jgi:group II intron reverse transcriptase/maturase
MQGTETLLSITQQRGARGLPLKNVYRMLYNRNLYLTAYGNLYRNRGAMTKGTTEETVDGMSLDKIDRIITMVRGERYRWSPARRIHIPKPNGKTRKLGIPTWSDKLLQEVIRLILEAYYEPQFSRHSHGFRPGRGCHTALTEIRHFWTGTHWFIEGDIAQCFDSLDHSVLLRILSKNVHDNRFLRLIERLLKAGYLEDWKYGATLSGSPQGAVLSPLLSNVYLNEFDRYITETLIPAYTRGEQRRKNAEYQRICNRLCYLRRKKGHGAEVKALIQERRKLPSMDPYDPDYKRLWYVRYADDHLLGLIGSKQEADQIKRQIKEWLSENLKLNLSEEKTLITNATQGAARFLGYEIVNQQCQTKCTNGQRSANGRIALRVPGNVIQKKCQPYLRGGKPIHLPEREVESDYSIVQGYQQEYRGIVQYYLLATNVCHLDRLRWIMEVSLLKTLAAKHRSSVKVMAAKYRAMAIGPDGKSRRCLEVRIERDERPTVKAQFGGLPLMRQDRAVLQDRPRLPNIHYTELERRVRASICEACGSTEQLEVHHIRKLNDIKGRGGRKVPAWRKHMMAIRRKTLVLCSTCHHRLHAGQFDDNFGMRC